MVQSVKRPLAAALALAACLGFSVSAAVYTVDVGETLQITDATAESYADGIAFADETGVVEFDTAAAPTMPISGAGTVAKVGTGGWVLNVAQSGFTGTWDFRAGAVTNGVAGCFGATGKTAGPVHVRSGATLVTVVNTPFQYRVLHVAGTGVNGEGAWVNKINDTTGLLTCLTLDDDATIALPNYFFFQANGTNALLDLNGHDLTLAPGSQIYMMNGTSANDGSIRLGDKCVFYFRGSFVFDFRYDVKLYASQAGESTKVLFYNECSPQDVPLLVAGTTILYHSHQFSADSTTGRPVYCNQTGDMNCWRGPIVLENAEACLKIGNGSSTLDETITVSGPISGPGRVEVFVDDGTKGRVVFSNPTNSFTGTLTVNEGERSTSVFEPVCSNAVPVYANFVVSGGRAHAKPGAEGWAWEADALARLAAQATFANGGFFAVDTSACPGKTLALSGAAIDAAPSNVCAFVCHEGEGRLIVEGPVAHPIAHLALGGSVEYTGEGPINLRSFPGAPFTARAVTGEAAVVSVDGVSITNFPAYLGVGYGAETLRVSDSRLNAFALPYMSSNSMPNATAEALVVGYKGQRGVLRIGEGSVVTGRIVCAAGSSAAQGAVCQNGGDVTLVGSGGDLTYASCAAEEGYGYYELKKGSLVLAGYGSVARAGGSHGVFAQYGGTFYTTNHPTFAMALQANKVSSFFNIARDGSSCGHYYLKGGTLRTHGNVLMVRGTGTSIVTLDGPDAFFDTRMNISHGYSTGTGIVNLNAGLYAGTFNSRFTKNKDGAADSYVKKGWRPTLYVNLGGGTIRFGGNPFGYCWDRCPDASNPGPTEVRLYAGGVTYDSKGADAIFENPLRQATGKGVAAVPWTPRGGYVGSPFVEISGDGRGASAFAQFDSDTGVVNGIRITSPGWDYTWAKAKILDRVNNAGTDSPANAWLEIDCALADNAPGAFTKTGAGTATFAATNTYEGATTVAEGTLKLGGADVIHPDSALVLAGGNFDAAGFAQNFSAIGGTAGQIKNAANVSATVRTLVNATTSALDFGALAALTVDGAWAIDLADVKAGRHPTYNADLAFAPGATLTIAGFDGLDPEDRRYTLLATAPGKTISGLPELTNVLPPGWALVNRGGEIRLFYRTGDAVFLR